MKRNVYLGLFLIALSTLNYEILLTRIFSVTMWYHFAFVAISIAMFGMTVGSLVVYLKPNYFTIEKTSHHLTLSALLFCISMVFSFFTHLCIPFIVEKSLIGFYFAKQAPERKMTRIQMPPHYSLFSGLDIPAGEKDFVLRDSYTLPVAAEAVGVGAHAHYIAKRMKMTATLPSGEVKTLLSISDWDFAWQDRYYFQQLVPLPKGTKLEAEIHWDNSAENPRNPSNPPVRVSWGEESKDEMGSISLITVAHEESELKTLTDDLSQRSRELARERMRNDPALAIKVTKILAE